MCCVLKHEKECLLIREINLQELSSFKIAQMTFEKKTKISRVSKKQA